MKRTLQPGHTSIERSPSLLRPAFIALFLQLQILLLASLVSSRDINFIEKIKFQLDFQDFFQATADWAHHVDPYLRERFVTPAPSLLVTLPLQPLGARAAGYIFFALNLVVLTLSMLALARRFKLDRDNRLLFFGIAAMFFPVMFLLERGNLDGLMLGLILLTIFSSHFLVRGLALGLSISFKIYSVLLFAPIALARHWRSVLAAAATLLVLLLSFHSLLGPFLHTQRTRSTGVSILENLSPAALLLHAMQHRLIRSIFIGLWGASFLALLYRTRQASPGLRSLYTLPWMMAMPLHVFPYTGVLLLPLLALRHAQVQASRAFSRQDLLFLVGFLLVGTQQRAATEYFMWLTHSHQLFGTFNALGTLLVMLSILFTPIAALAQQPWAAEPALPE